MPRNVAILLFDDVEVLDFAGPFEVFAVCSEITRPQPFNVFTASAEGTTIAARNGLRVTPQHALADAPAADVMILPGGSGSRNVMHDPAVIAWIKTTAERAEVVLTVCTGARFLAKAELLNGLTITTHHEALDELKQLAPKSTVVGDRRWIDNGRIVTAAGVAAGIDASFHVLRRLLGEKCARRCARYIEYPWDAAAHDA